MREQDQGKVATVFDRIAAEERSHLDRVTAWSETRGGPATRSGCAPLAGSSNL